MAWRREPIYGLLKKLAAAGWPAGRQVLAAADSHYWAITPARTQPDIDLGVLAPDTLFEVDLTSDGRLKLRSSGRTD